MIKKHNLVLGALVGDAASLGLHWIYDQPRIKTLAGDSPEFFASSAKHYEGVPSYFAHPLKSTGDQTQYGEQLMVLLRSLGAKNGHYDQHSYNAEFIAHFGYGGTYCGYIDHATRATLNNLAGGNTETASGADDTQLPAISKLPALIAAHQEEHAIAAIRTTSNTDIAEIYGLVAVAMLCAARDGANVEVVVRQGIEAADPSIRPALEAACAATHLGCEDFTANVGMACELASGLPSVMHTLLSTSSFKTAIRRNILAGGDSCGRAILLGGVLGAVHGTPEDWLAHLNHLSVTNNLLNALIL